VRGVGVVHRWSDGSSAGVSRGAKQAGSDSGRSAAPGQGGAVGVLKKRLIKEATLKKATARAPLQGATDGCTRAIHGASRDPGDFLRGIISYQVNALRLLRQSR
jgi:hypothetical protein